MSDFQILKYPKIAIFSKWHLDQGLLIHIVIYPILNNFLGLIEVFLFGGSEALISVTGKCVKLQISSFLKLFEWIKTSVSGASSFPGLIQEKQTSSFPSCCLSTSPPSSKHTDSHIYFSWEPYVFCHMTLSVAEFMICVFSGLQGGSGRGSEGMSGWDGRKENQWSSIYFSSERSIRLSV